MGLEPTIFGTTIRRVNQLHYTCLLYTSSLHTIAEMKDISTVITNKTPDFRYIKEANDGHTELIVVDEEV